jgi:lysophospholipase L1-like esterase
MKRAVWCWLCLAAACLAQPRALLSRPEAVKTYQQIINLLESTSVAMPELGKAAAPLVDNARQDMKSLQTTAYDHAAVLYRFLSYVRAYLDLSEALPKPDPFADDARKQLAALRDQHTRLEVHFRALLDSKEQRLRSADRDNLRRYAEANQALGPPKPGESRVVFLGDSITDGWRLNEYFPGKPYVNRGIGGQITGEMLGRMKADVIDLKPAAMVVLGGTNDLARGVPLATIQNNLTMIADLAGAYGIKPILASILPIHDYHKDQDPNYEQSSRRPPSQILAMNQWIQNLCKLRGYTYLDYFSALVDDKGFLKADLAQDGLHPNAAGYRIMGPLAEAAIEKTLRTPAPAGKLKRGKKP